MSEQHNQVLWPDVCGSGSGSSSGQRVCARNRLHKTIPDGLIPNRVTDYTPRMVTQKYVLRNSCVMIPD